MMHLAKFLDCISDELGKIMIKTYYLSLIAVNQAAISNQVRSFEPMEHK